MSCGRIVCEQEGVGECFTCGTFVMTKEERSMLLTGSLEAKRRIEELIQQGAYLDFLDSVYSKSPTLFAGNEGLERAIEHKEKLLEYDRKSVARTKVFDDQLDYFGMKNQVFISQENRSAVQNKVDFLVENKFNTKAKVRIDFQNMTVSDYDEAVIKDIDAEHKKLEQLSEFKSDYELRPSAQFINDSKSAQDLPPPIYVPSVDETKKQMKTTKKSSQVVLPKVLSMSNFSKRVQDKELNLIDDRGMCLAMRQPWASLLVAGIKRFEGRTWYSAFKGRLWIYAAMKPPTPEEMSQVESLYRNIGYAHLPNSYPTGVIVGCVTVEECLPNETIFEQYPDCEVDSPYAFVCTYPIQLKPPVPVMNGGGKQIYKLQPDVHRTCKKMLGF